MWALEMRCEPVGRHVSDGWECFTGVGPLKAYFGPVRIPVWVARIVLWLRYGVH